jgi:hypothetical protein
MRDDTMFAKHHRAQRVIRILAQCIEDHADSREVARRLKADPGALTEFVAAVGGDDSPRVLELAHHYYTDVEGRA